ncbi:hypothetical protein BC833DRAFT_604214 [Globomyces pollinis-pini]|nr:hypothetical protein BC833DRAFT_604214 [Globomyces pollinis-pini]
MPYSVPSFFGVSFKPVACDQTNFQPCRDLAVQYRETTCTPMMSTNITNYNACLCYNAVEDRYLVCLIDRKCFNQCSGDKDVDAIYSGEVQPKVTSQCAVAGLNPEALPANAPWTTKTPETSTPTGPKPVTSILPTQTSSASDMSVIALLVSIGMAIYL